MPELETPGSNTASSCTGDGTAPDIALPTAGAGTTSRIIDGGVGIVEFTGDVSIAPPPAPKIETVEMNAKYDGLTFYFPRSKIRPIERAFDLTDAIHPIDITVAAKTVSDSGTVLQRQALHFTSKRLRTISDEDVNVDSISIDIEEAKAGLIEEAIHMRNFEATPNNVRALRVSVVPQFVHDTGITERSVKALASARTKLHALIEKAAREHRCGLGEETIVTPHELPVAPQCALSEGEGILERLGSDAKAKDFIRYRHYAPWSRGLFIAAAFDSFSAEYRLAELLDRSPSVQWWKRLYGPGRASIAYTTTQNYYPDFVVFDADGYHWIIEGKADGEESNAVVQAKRQAAEKLIPKLMIHEKFAEQLWGYAIAFESDVRAAESWDHLIGSLNPVKTPRY